MRLPHMRTGSTISLVERQVEVLREQKARRPAAGGVRRVARANDAARRQSSSLHAPPAARPHSRGRARPVEASLREDFDAFHSALLLIARPPQRPSPGRRSCASRRKTRAHVLRNAARHGQAPLRHVLRRRHRAVDPDGPRRLPPAAERRAGDDADRHLCRLSPSVLRRPAQVHGAGKDRRHAHRPEPADRRRHAARALDLGRGRDRRRGRARRAAPAPDQDEPRPAHARGRGRLPDCSPARRARQLDDLRSRSSSPACSPRWSPC